jgi:DNA-binding MarR family transcriptional regulator
VLDALARGAYTRRELDEFTEASRTTLDRIVNELEERGWAERTTDGDYVATPTGRRLVAETKPFVGSVAAIRQLGEAVAWLPDDLSIGLHHFQDAGVRRPGGSDPIETGDYFVELLQETTTFRVLTNLAAPGPVGRALRDRVLADEMAVDADCQYPATTGPTPFGAGVFAWYLSRLTRTAHTDGTLRDALYRVIMMEEPPTALLRPGVVVRLLRPTLPGRGPLPQGTGEPTRQP